MSETLPPRIYLSPPHMGAEERQRVQEVFDSNWLSPAGPDLARFEAAFSQRTGSTHCLAVNSGTSALHLAFIEAGIGPGDLVLCSSLTFVASANVIRYVGAEPVFLDSETQSWNLDPERVREAIEKLETKPRALLVVHLYGQSADLDSLLSICQEHDILLIEDAAEALGTTYKDKHVGKHGLLSVYSFNGNKMITTSAGGMLVSEDAELIERARKRSSQAREPCLHYEHTILGYNYRMSNLLAAIGIAQLASLDGKIARRRAIFERYQETLSDLPGVTFQPEASWGQSTRWLTCLTLDAVAAPVRPLELLQAMSEQNIEARPVWKPMHQQPLYEGTQYFGSAVSDRLFDTGLCLPSGSSLTDDEQTRVIETFRAVFAT